MRPAIAITTLLACLASRGLAQDPTLWIVDDVQRTVYQVTRTGSLLTSFPVVDDGRSSVAVDRVTDSLWGASEKRIQLANYSRTGVPIAVIPATSYDPEASQPEGVDIDESTDTLWAVDDDSLRVSNLRRDGTLLSFFRTTDFAARATSPQAIAWDPTDGSLWVTDNSARDIYHVTTGGQLVGTIRGADFDPAAPSLQGISVDRANGTLWVSARDTQTVYNITTTGTLLSSFGTTSFGCTAPVGVGYDGAGGGGGGPVAEFSGSPLAGQAPLIVEFTDESTGSPAAWLWEFGDGQTSTVQHPTHLYADGGTYTVTLTVQNASGLDIETKVDYVTAAGAASLWLADDRQRRIYQVSLRGELVTSFPMVLEARDSISVDRLHDSLWATAEKKKWIVNFTKTGELISFIDTTTFDPLAVKPQGVDVDESDDTLWSIDKDTHRVYHIQKDGTLLGSFSMTDIDPLATKPREIAWDPADGTLWLVDEASDLIYHLTTAGQLIGAIPEGAFEFYGGGNMRGISVDRTNGTLWIADKKAKVFYNVTTDGTLLRRVDTKQFGANDPTGIAFDLTGGPGIGDAGTLWVSDDANLRIYHVSMRGELLTSFRSVEDARSSVSVDAFAGTLWGASEGRDQIVNYTKDGQPISVIASAIFDPEAGETEAVVVDEFSDTLWVVDDTSHRVSNIERDGTLLSFFRTTDFDPLSDSPQGLAWDSSSGGSLWVVDNRSHEIYNVSTTGVLISQISRTRTTQLDFPHFAFDPAAHNLQDIDVDGSNGTLWVAIRGSHTVYNLTRSGEFLSSFNTELFGSSNPTGVAYEGPDTGTTCSFTTYGEACGVTLTGNALRGIPEHQINLELSGAPTNSVGLLVIGVAEPGGVAIPGSDCMLFIQPPLAIVPMDFDGGGVARHSLNIDALTPLTVSFQGAYVAFSTTVELGTSNGLTLTCVE